MLVKDALIQLSPQIKCSLCGNCCPCYCRAKSGNLCTIHPEQPDSQIYHRGINCEASPLFFALEMGVFCEPVLRMIAELTGGDTFKEVHNPENGIKFIENYGPFTPNRTKPPQESDFWKSMHKEV